MPARITIDGNLVADPDFAVSNTGTSWAHLRIASHERIKRNGEWVSTEPEFFNVTVFGKASEIAADTLHKGDRVTVEGRPELEMFARRDGSTGAGVKVYARAVTRVDDDALQGAGRGAAVADRDTAQDATPTIHHTSLTTMVAGIGRTATALHRILKDHGFRWSPKTASWNLPEDMDEHTRAGRVSDVLSVVRENGRDIPVVNQPAPGRNQPPVTAGVEPVTPGQAPTVGRSL